MTKIFIVDDEKPLAKALSNYLKQRGFETDIAFDGQEALNRMNEVHPDVILLDIYMPKLGGIETLKILKNQPETKDIPVIMLTNFDDRDKIIESSDTGSLLYFVKSGTSLHLLATYIHNLLG